MITQILAKVLPVLVMIILGRVCATKGILNDEQHAGLKNVIGDILRLTEGSLAPVECLANAENPCPKQQKCATIMLWEKVDKAIRDVVDHVTLQDLLDWQKQERC